MAGILDFKGRAAAEAWKAEAEALNERTEQKLKQVTACLQDIKGESVGDMVDHLFEAGGEMIEATTVMAKAMRGIVDMVSKMISSFIQALADAVSGVDSQKGTMTHL